MSVNDVVALCPTFAAKPGLWDREGAPLCLEFGLRLATCVGIGGTSKDDRELPGCEMAAPKDGFF